MTTPEYDVVRFGLEQLREALDFELRLDDARCDLVDLVEAGPEDLVTDEALLALARKHGLAAVVEAALPYVPDVVWFLPRLVTTIADELCAAEEQRIAADLAALHPPKKPKLNLRKRGTTKETTT